MSPQDLIPVASAVAATLATLGVPRLVKAIGEAWKKRADAGADVVVINATSEAKTREADSTVKRQLAAERASLDSEQEKRVFDRLMAKVEEQDKAREARILHLEQHVATLEKERDAARTARDDLQRTAQELAERASAVANTLTKTERRVFELTAACTRLEELLAGAREQIEQLRAALHIAYLEKADLEAQLERERARGRTDG
jgi:chromosome segregation ATPase